MSTNYVRMAVFLQAGCLHEEDDPLFGPESFDAVLTILVQSEDRVYVMHRHGDETHVGDGIEVASYEEGTIRFMANYESMRREPHLMHMANYGEGACTREEYEEQGQGREAIEVLMELLRSQANHPSTTTERVPDDAHYGLYL